MTNNIAVSVIIPVYNAAPYLRECLDSVINQTLWEIEIICVDDGSTDNSLDILREYGRVDSRVRVLTRSHEDDTGAGPARNMGMDASSGRYLYFLDADDFFTEDSALAWVVARAEETGADVTLFDAFFYDDKTRCYVEPETWSLNKSRLPERELFSSDDIHDYFLQITSVDLQGKLFRRSFIVSNGLCCQSVNYNDDIFLSVMSMACAKKITVLNRRLSAYRINTSSSQTSRCALWPSSRRDAFLAVKNMLEERGLYDKLRRSFVNLCADHQLDQLNRIAFSSYAVFCELYLRLRSWLQELDLLGHPREYFYNPLSYDWLKFIAANKPSNDIFYELRMMGYYVYCSFPPFPTDRIAHSSAVVLYGAGAVGRMYHEWLSCSKYCNVVLWLDRKAKELWPPITEPSSIVGAHYDYVVIAVSNSTVAQAIVNDLTTNYGVAPERLVYVCE